MDLERLHEFTDGDPKTVRDLVGLYLQQTAEQLQNIQAALAATSAPDLKRAAHCCSGSSATCGMNAILPPLRELERLAHEQQLDAAPRQLEQANLEFGRIKAFLTVYLKSLDSVASDR